MFYVKNLKKIIKTKKSKKFLEQIKDISIYYNNTISFDKDIKVKPLKKDLFYQFRKNNVNLYLKNL